MFTKKDIDIAGNCTRLKYSMMDTVDINCRDAIIVYDISYYISYLERISNIDDTFNDNDLNIDTLTNLVYSILNNVAHYRHYIYNNNIHNNVILFASNKNHYDKYSNTFKSLTKFIKLFDKTFFIEKIDSDENVYPHMVYFISSYITLLYNKLKRNVRSIYIGNNPILFQMLNIDKNMIHIRNNNIISGLDIFFKSKTFNIGDTTIDIRSTNIIGKIISLVGYRNGFSRLNSIRNVRNKALYKSMIQNLDNPLINIQLSDNDMKEYERRIKIIDIEYQNHIFMITKKLIKIWESNIKTKGIYSINDLLNNNTRELNVNWLLEM